MRCGKYKTTAIKLVMSKAEKNSATSLVCTLNNVGQHECKKIQVKYCSIREFKI